MAAKDKLTDVEIKKAKPRAKPWKLADGRGLYVEVTPTGSKLWRAKYRIHGHERRASFGQYPTVSLARARALRDELLDLLHRGVDPSVHKRVEKAKAENTFEAVAVEWLAKFGAKLAPAHLTRVESLFRRDLYPWLGSRPVALIEPPEVLTVLRRIESRGALETAHRARQKISQVMRYAVATGRATQDPTVSLRGALPPAVPTKMPAIVDRKRLGELLRAIDGYRGTYAVRIALQLAPLVFARPFNLRAAEWSEFDLDAALWRIPASKMKGRGDYMTPLPVRAVELLRELHRLTGRGRYVFPGLRSHERPMSENTLNGALRRLGFPKDEAVTHGFRSTASSLLNEMGWNPDAIERQLAHVDGEVRGAYNRADYLEERRQMLEAWAGVLDSLRRGADVVPIGAARAASGTGER